jgi:hypothetical protein
MLIGSTSLVSGKNIPEQFTCRGANISPDIYWKSLPAKTKSLALVMEDPDAPAGTWVHWVVYNIPAETPSLPTHLPAKRTMEDGTRQGKNSFGDIGYGGPCPPPGHGPHRYFFRLYALDTLLNLEPGADKEELTTAMDGHILGKAELMGRFER